MEGLHILLVEDSEDDILIAKRAFKEFKVITGVHVVMDGEEALAFLTHSGKYVSSQPPKPALILLDITLPLMDGFAVLRRLKADENLKKIPVVMLTTSSREEDVQKSYAAGAASFITKPASLPEFLAQAREFEQYWTAVSRLPA